MEPTKDSTQPVQDRFFAAWQRAMPDSARDFDTFVKRHGNTLLARVTSALEAQRKAGREATRTLLDFDGVEDLYEGAIEAALTDYQAGRDLRGEEHAEALFERADDHLARLDFLTAKNDPGAFPTWLRLYHVTAEVLWSSGLRPPRAASVTLNCKVDAGSTSRTYVWVSAPTSNVVLEYEFVGQGHRDHAWNFHTALSRAHPSATAALSALAAANLAHASRHFLGSELRFATDLLQHQGDP